MEYLRSKLWKRTDKSAKIFAIGLNALKFTENYGFHVAIVSRRYVFFTESVTAVKSLLLGWSQHSVHAVKFYRKLESKIRGTKRIHVSKRSKTALPLLYRSCKSGAQVYDSVPINCRFRFELLVSAILKERYYDARVLLL